MIETSYMRFSLEEQKKGLHTQLINYLLEYNKTSEGSFVEILIKPAGYEDVIIVEWIQNDYNDSEYEDHFKAVGADEHIMFEYQFPDEHFEWVESMEEGQERVDEWLKENPGWIKNSYGRWINKEENDRLRREFGILDEEESKKVIEQVLTKPTEEQIKKRQERNDVLKKVLNTEPRGLHKAEGCLEGDDSDWEEK